MKSQYQYWCVCSPQNHENEWKRLFVVNDLEKKSSGGQIEWGKSVVISNKCELSESTIDGSIFQYEHCHGALRSICCLSCYSDSHFKRIQFKMKYSKSCTNEWRVPMKIATHTYSLHVFSFCSMNNVHACILQYLFHFML